MGVSLQNGGGGRRKSVDADLNLVPYIDLLTCMIAFLLIAAVWTQLARLHVRQKGQGELGEETSVDTFKISVLVHADGFTVAGGHDQQPVPRTPRGYDFERLTQLLKQLKSDHPDKTDVQVLSEDAIVFESLVATMDAAMSAGFVDIALLDAVGAPL